MADLKRWPMALNQPGYDYPAELFRAEHHDATSGGNGVGAPTALKVTAQAAPDGTVSILPGGATVKSTYAGADGQSYHARNFQPFTLEVPPTGSSSDGRHDLVILRVCDPQYEPHPEHGGGEISEEEAANYDFWWFELHQGKSETTSFDFPHVKLAHIRRGPNQTVVQPSEIIDLRELANPKNHLHFRANNMQSEDYGTLSTAVTIWPTNSIHTMRIPEWATRVQVLGNWNTIAADTTNRTVGVVYIDLTHPDGSVIRTENSRFQNVRVGGNAPTETLNVILSDNRPVPEKFRGQLVTVRMRGTKISGPNIYMDGNSSWSVQLYFEQEIA